MMNVPSVIAEAVSPQRRMQIDGEADGSPALPTERLLLDVESVVEQKSAQREEPLSFAEPSSLAETSFAVATFSLHPRSTALDKAPAFVVGSPVLGGSHALVPCPGPMPML